MPLTQCPRCRRLQALDREIIGREVGCMSPRCEAVFRAQEYRRHSGPLSPIFFFGVIGFAVYLAIVWVNREFGVFSWLSP